jgi:cyanosortase A-associated protein
VTILNWRPVDRSVTIADKEITEPNSASKVSYKVGMRYQFAIAQQIIVVDMRYLVRTTGDVLSFLRDYAQIEVKPEQLQKGIRHRDGVGYYTIFTVRDRVYLSACINPRGHSSVTVEQYDDNMTAHAMQPSTIASWLLAQADLRDRRCLWTQFSTTLEGEGAISVAHRLEQAWFLWYEWWKVRFPVS